MKILVGYDGSNVSKEAITIAAKHANAFKAEIILVHSMVGGPEVPRKDFEDAEKELDYEKNMLLDKKIPCKPILSVRGLEPGEDLDQRDRINYYICRLRDAAHPENAVKFLDFIKSARAQGIYEAHGFVPHFETSS